MDSVGRSKIAFFTLSANCNVDEVSLVDVIDGDAHIIKRILPDPNKESLKILVNFESLNGIWLRD